MTTGIELIAQERERQGQLGFDADHDREHGSLILISAAVAYAITGAGNSPAAAALHWPWGLSSFHPRGSRRDLIKAGALIAAAIDAQGKSE